jgi:formate hydrogenlyase subunit 3/multisubunit Na+/H+ antiporter MnhD subunit
MSTMLLGATLAIPLAMLLGCLSRRLRERMPALLALAPLPAMAAALLAAGAPPLVLDLPQLQVTLALDPPGAILLGVSALLWIGAGAYASTYLQGAPQSGRFSVFWLLTLTGSLGIFMAADLWSFFVLYAVVSLAAYGLVIHDGTPHARRAGIIYLTLAVLGEAFLLMGFVTLVAADPDGSLLIRDVVAALPASHWRGMTLALLIAGFGLKCGLVPLHVWMPVTYRAAPVPAAAVLSGAASKAGVIGLIRFLPFDVSLPDWGGMLATAGLISAFYGVAVGITQRNPKTVLAYSSVSQMGVIAAVLGMALAAGDGGAPSSVAFYAAHHVLVKGALFLAVGVVAATSPHRLWPALLPASVLALGLGGLPFTGGALAKLAVKETLGSGVVGLLATLSAAGTTLLMLHFLYRLAQSAGQDPVVGPSGRLTGPWLAMAFASIAIPWALYPAAIGSLSEAIDPAELWATLWPVLLGGALAIALQRWRHSLPRVPEGDILLAGEGAARAVASLGDALERGDGLLRRWPVASLWVVALAIAFGAAMLAGQ